MWGDGCQLSGIQSTLRRAETSLERVAWLVSWWLFPEIFHSKEARSTSVENQKVDLQKEHSKWLKRGAVRNTELSYQTIFFNLKCTWPYFTILDPSPPCLPFHRLESAALLTMESMHILKSLHWLTLRKSFQFHKTLSKRPNFWTMWRIHNIPKRLKKGIKRPKASKGIQFG